jgi:mannose-1-phosphate guanylyltransferase
MNIVIMAGGKGTRFWPRSRTSTPKQLLDITGEKTMIQETVSRVLPLVSHDKILIITNKHQAASLRSQLPDIPHENIIAEPVGRNTAPCICLAATLVHKRDPEGEMIVLPADHYIEDTEAFLLSLKKAAEIARKTKSLITIGIFPEKPETGYGYIEFDDKCQSSPSDAYKVISFHEKPHLKKAEEFLNHGNYLWNSGMFIWKASVILEEINKYLPAVYSNIIKVKELWDTPEIEKAIESAYSKTDSISIDYGVLEKSDNVFTLKGLFGWNDIGSWSAVHDISQKDKNSNTLRGDVICLDSKNITVYSPEKLTAVVGLKDIIIVNTDDALLVCAKNSAQDVKKVVEQLDENGRNEYL